MHGCYTCVLVTHWGSPLSFGVLRGALVLCHPFGVRFEVDVLVSPPSEVEQGLLLEYPPSEMAWSSSALAALNLLVVNLVE